MKMLLVVSFCLRVLHVAAQDETWSDGVVVTTDDQVLTGQILYNPSFDLVVFRDHSSRTVVMASKMRSLRYFDASSNINRRFITVQASELSNSAKIFEVVLDGEVAVLRRSKSGSGASPSDCDGYNYFFARNKIIVPLKKFRNKFYPEVKELLRDDAMKLGLNPSDEADAIRLIEIYNARQFSASLARN